MSAEVWAVRPERPLTESEERKLLSLLPEERRERLLRTRKEKQAEVLWAYALLRLALWERYGWQSLPEITLAERGKPVFLQHPEVHFSLSHTEGAALVGLSDRPVGVDIEKIRPIKERTMREVADTDSETEFFKVWVRREARGKRTGAGMAGMLRREPPMESEEACRELDLFPGYFAGISLSGERSEVRVCSPEELLLFTEAL